MRGEEEFTGGHEELKHGASGGEAPVELSCAAPSGRWSVCAWTEEKKRRGCQGERREAVIHVS